jgi:cell division protease FtsH
LLAVLEASCPTVDSYEVGAAELTGDIVRAIAEALQTSDRPSIVAISQLEAIATVESGLGGSASSEARGAVWALIDALDPGVHPPSGRQILWIATSTADPMFLESALIRRGRFGDLRISLSPPGREAREAIVTYLCARRRTVESIDAARVAERTVGATPADLVAIVEDALRRSIAAGHTGIASAPLMEAVADRDAEISEEDITLSSAQRRAVAVHEASHAVVALALGLSVTEINAEPHRGRTHIGPDDGAAPAVGEAELMAQVTVLAAGVAGERAVFGDVLLGSGHDTSSATSLLARWADNGLAPDLDMLSLDALGPWPGVVVQNARSGAIRTALAACTARARTLVDQNRAAIERLADGVLAAGGDLAGADLVAALSCLAMRPAQLE